MSEVYGKKFVEKGGTVRLNFEVDNFKDSTLPDYPLTVFGKGMVGWWVFAEWVLKLWDS